MFSSLLFLKWVIHLRKSWEGLSGLVDGADPGPLRPIRSKLTNTTLRTHFFINRQDSISKFILYLQSASTRLHTQTLHDVLS